MSPERIYTATIRDMRTGEARAVQCDAHVGPSTIAFMWCDGNYCCDCNRGAFFYGQENEEEEEDFPCSVWENRFRLERLEWSDGTLLADENDHRHVWEDEQVSSYPALVVGEFLQACGRQP